MYCTREEWRAAQRRWREEADARSEPRPASCVGSAAAGSHLSDLLSQWGETERLYRLSGERDLAYAYRECMAELREVMSGDLRAIEKW